VYGNIGTNDRRGDPIRERVKVGWSVLWKLSDIACEMVFEKAHYNLEASSGSISHLTCGMPFVRKLETCIKTRQKTYIATRSIEDVWNYRLLHSYLSAAFRDRVFDDPRSRNLDWRTGNEFGVGNSWLNWFVLREGPKFFAKAWASRDGNAECLNLIRTEWSSRPKEQVLIEHSAAREVWEDVCEIVWRMNSQERHANMTSFFKEARGKEMKREHRDILYHLGRRLSKEVIRSIEMDYSDYSS